MIRELVYTSAPKGLKPGSQGFCTVVATKGLPDLLRERAEALSGYRVAFPAHSAQAGLNPVAWSHLAWSLGGSRLHILSRVGHAGLDFEGRINKIAHHLLLEPSDFVPAGPAWLLAQPGVMRAAWDGRIGWLPADRVLPHGDVPPRRCSAWEGATGDPGWAGMLAESFLDDPSRPAFLEFTPGRDLLPLVAEAIALLPPERRWDVTFSTYYTGLPQDISCAWRGVLRDSPEALQARLTPGALVVPIEPRGRAPESSFRGLVSFARTGTPPLARAATPPPSPGSQPFQPDWGFAEPPALGDPATPYGLVEEAEPKRGRKLGSYRRDPSKPPPLFRQTGVEERSKRWMVWVAVAVVLVGGIVACGWFLWGGAQPHFVENSSSPMKSLPEEESKSHMQEERAEDRRGNKGEQVKAVVSGADTSGAEGKASVDGKEAALDRPAHEPERNETEQPVLGVNGNNIVFDTYYIDLGNSLGRGGDLECGCEINLGDERIRDVRLELYQWNSGSLVAVKGMWNQGSLVYSLQDEKNDLEGGSEYGVDEKVFKFAIEGSSVFLRASKETVEKSYKTLQKIGSCCLVVRDLGKKDDSGRGVHCVVWMKGMPGVNSFDVAGEKFLSAISRELSADRAGGGDYFVGVTERNFVVVLAVPCRRGVVFHTVETGANKARPGDVYAPVRELVQGGPWMEMGVIGFDVEKGCVTGKRLGIAFAFKNRKSKNLYSLVMFDKRVIFDGFSYVGVKKMKIVYNVGSARPRANEPIRGK